MIFIHIVENTDAIEPEVTTIEVQIVPPLDPNDPFSVPPPLEDDHETDPDDSLQLGNNHADDDDDDDNEGPAALNIKPTACSSQIQKTKGDPSRYTSDAV